MHVITRVLWNTYPVHCCCMKLCETQLIAEEDYKFARTHTFALLTMVIAWCTIKHLWIWTCWTNCTVFFMSIRKVQTYNEPGRDVTWTALVISVYSVWDVTWTAINALVISSDLCSVDWQCMEDCHSVKLLFFDCHIELVQFRNLPRGVWTLLVSRASILVLFLCSFSSS